VAILKGPKHAFLPAARRAVKLQRLQEN